MLGYDALEWSAVSCQKLLNLKSEGCTVITSASDQFLPTAMSSSTMQLYPKWEEVVATEFNQCVEMSQQHSLARMRL